MPSNSVLNFYQDKFSPLFQCVEYRLDLKNLKKENHYFIFMELHTHTMLVIEFLRNITFSKEPEKITLEKREFGNQTLYSFSFPKEYKETCERIAKLYGLMLRQISQASLVKENNTKSLIVIPSSELISVVREAEKAPISGKIVVGDNTLMVEIALKEQAAEVNRLKQLGQSLDNIKQD